MNFARPVRFRLLTCLVAAASLVSWLHAAREPGLQQPRSQLVAIPGDGQAFRNEEERKGWEAVSQAPEQRRGQLARIFLEKHPTTAMASLAHQFIAIEAFRGSDFETFERHALQAIGGPIWLPELEVQLAYYYAERGRHPESIRLAGALLNRLQSAPGSDLKIDLEALQQRAQLTGTAQYALGRSALGQAVSQADPTTRQGLLNRAIGHLTGAVQRNPSDDYAAYRLGEAYLQQGRSEEASLILARAVNLDGFASAAALETLRRIEPFATSDKSRLDHYLDAQQTPLRLALQTRPRSIFSLEEGRPHVILWWDSVPEDVRQASLPGPRLSNIRFSDYVGPESCRDCHKARFESWSNHSHRRMNALAGAESVKGDFQGAVIHYLGGRANFFERDGRYRMKLERGGLQRIYQVERTVGSRFFQYYVGKQISGPESREHPIWTTDHLLPFGYWLDEQEWVPVVHIDAGGELPDSQREDPFRKPSAIAYDPGCSPCHTTRPIGDWMIQSGGRQRLGTFSPHPVSFLISEYLTESHPELIASGQNVSSREIERIVSHEMDQLDAARYAVTLGISCEACHNGAREHVRRSSPLATSQPPFFFPSSPNLFLEGSDTKAVWGRSPENLNWICARCHSGSRPQFAGGIDTWNSTEYSDAARGFCYSGDDSRYPSLSHLRCVDCHDPHLTIGKGWSQSPASDDARCLGCHQNFQESEARSRHTHHPPDTPGARCMNCHMPRINEGIQDVVRTHHIFNPTDAKMVEGNQPNACNLCHLKEGIDWTLGYLGSWYGARFSDERITSHYSDRDSSVALGWIASSSPAVRLVAADALTRGGASWALPALFDALDDPYLLNRQFAQRGLEKMLGIDLEDFGYRFYMLDTERRKPLARLRRSLLEDEGGR